MTDTIRLPMVCVCQDEGRQKAEERKTKVYAQFAAKGWTANDSNLLTIALHCQRSSFPGPTARSAMVYFEHDECWWCSSCEVFWLRDGSHPEHQPEEPHR